MNTNGSEHLDTINEIRGLMERSSKFVSLSGIAGIAAGVIAMLGCVVASLYLKIGFFDQAKSIVVPHHEDGTNVFFIILLLLIVFLLALASALFFSSRKAKKKNIIFWDAMARRVFLNHFIFLFTGGIFCWILFYYGLYFLIVASMLIFYGLALVNVSKFTFNEIAQLGILEICLGIFSAFVTVYPLLIWFIGFGILHLLYGTYVYIKYEKA